MFQRLQEVQRSLEQCSGTLKISRLGREEVRSVDWRRTRIWNAIYTQDSKRLLNDASSAIHSLWQTLNYGVQRLHAWQHVLLVHSHFDRPVFVSSATQCAPIALVERIPIVVHVSRSTSNSKRSVLQHVLPVTIPFLKSASVTLFLSIWLWIYIYFLLLLFSLW